MAKRKRSERLEPVRKVAGRDEQDASRELARSQQVLAEQESRLEQLRNYRDEYRRMLSGGGGQAVDPRRLRDQRAFLARLDEVIEQQEQVVRKSQEQYEQQRSGWIDARSRVNALGQAADRYRRDEQRSADRREQREQDDLAQKDNGGPGSGD